MQDKEEEKRQISLHPAWLLLQAYSDVTQQECFQNDGLSLEWATFTYRVDYYHIITAVNLSDL